MLARIGAFASWEREALVEGGVAWMTARGAGNTGPEWDVIDDALAAAAALKHRIASIHTERACPKCGARVGERCYSLRPGYCATPAHTKHPHVERYRDLVR